MKKYPYVLIFGAVTVSLFCLNSNAFALGGGGFRNEAALDAKANGMADAFVAQADSPSAVHYNPAGLVQLKGDHVTIGYTVEAPRNSSTNLSGNETQMQMQTFWIPNFYYVSDLNGNKEWRLGLSVTSPYGLGTDWADDSFSKFQATESTLKFYQINPTVAYKVNDAVSVGFGIDYMRAELEKHRRINDGNEGDLLLKGDDEGWGYNIGLLYRPSERHRIGASYRSEIDLVYEGQASLDNLTGGAYTLLFPDYYSTQLETKLALPRTWAVGYAYKPNEKWTIEIDCELTEWSSVQEDFVTYPGESDTNRLAVLNGGNPSAKDWNDSLAYGIGAEYQATDRLALRGGYLFIENPIPSANFESALPDSDKHCFTLGTGYKLNDGLTLDLAYFGVLLEDRDVTNDTATVFGADLDGKYEGYVNIVSVGFTYKY